MCRVVEVVIIRFYLDGEETIQSACIEMRDNQAFDSADRSCRYILYTFGKSGAVCRLSTQKEIVMLEIEPLCFSSDCPSRALFDQIADKWSMMVLAVLDDGPQRFNAIRRRLQGVTQKSLTQCLRRLERNGLVSREVISFSPVAVQYQITPLGQTLQQPFRALHEWTVTKLPEVDAARQAFDATANGTTKLQK